MKRTVALLSLTIAVVALAFGQPEPGPCCMPDRQPMRGQMAPDIMQKLNLTEQQQEQSKKLRLELERKQVQNQSKIRLARLDLRELMGADNPDKGLIEKKMKEISDLQYQQKLATVDLLFAMKALLSPEQQRIWKEHMKKGGPEMQRRMKMRMRDGQGPRGEW